MKLLLVFLALSLLTACAQPQDTKFWRDISNIERRNG